MGTVLSSFLAISENADRTESMKCLCYFRANVNGAMTPCPIQICAEPWDGASSRRHHRRQWHQDDRKTVKGAFPFCFVSVPISTS